MTNRRRAVTVLATLFILMVSGLAAGLFAYRWYHTPLAPPISYTTRALSPDYTGLWVPLAVVFGVLAVVVVVELGGIWRTLVLILRAVNRVPIQEGTTESAARKRYNESMSRERG